MDKEDTLVIALTGIIILAITVLFATIVGALALWIVVEILGIGEFSWVTALILGIVLIILVKLLK